MPLNRRVKNRENKVGITSGLKGPFHSFLFNRVIRRMNPCRVGKTHGNPIPDGFPLNDISGGSGNRSDNGPFFTKEGIEEGGFANVGPPEKSDGNPFPSTSIPLEGPDQTSGQSKSIPKMFNHQNTVDGIDIFFAEVEPDFN